MNIVGIAGLGIVGAALAVILKQYKPEYRMFVSIAVGLLIFALVLEEIVPVLENINDIVGRSAMPGQYLGVLLKALGICFICQPASDCCRDVGESAIASKIDAAGKIAILVLALPLISELLDTASRLFGN